MMRFLVTLLLLGLIFLSYEKLSVFIAADGEQASNSLALAGYDPPSTRPENVTAYTSISERPLFDPTRRPMVVAAKENPKPKPKPAARLNAKALGIAVIDEMLLAVVRNTRSGKIHRLRIGDVIDGWTLKSVSPNKFVFEHDGRSETISYSKDGDNNG